VQRGEKDIQDPTGSLSVPELRDTAGLALPGPEGGIGAEDAPPGRADEGVRALFYGYRPFRILAYRKARDAEGFHFQTAYRAPYASVYLIKR
jgi:hypothetical protein